jgi:TatD DNase family protein
MIAFYDAHNHLHDERLSRRVEEILAALPKLGVRGCVVNGTGEGNWPAVEALAKRFSWIVPAFGVHPWFAKERSSSWFDTLRRLIDANPRATIGEVGLDRWIRDHDVGDQERVFVAQLQLATERNLPVSIHCLQAWGLLDDLLKANARPGRGFLLHSYSGPAEMIPSFTKLGAYFSISGYFAREQKAAKRDVFKKVPMERLLIETDAPDMLPPAELIAHDFGEANDPRNLPRIYDFAANLVGMPVDDFAKRIAANFQSLFA